MAKVLINKERAQELLGNNDHNRKLIKARVNEYALEMVNGMWMYNGESIIISESGRLLDGQHRLEAIIQADVEVEVELVEDVPDSDDGVDTFLTINTKNRSNVDALTIAGFNDRPHQIAKLMVLKEAFESKKLMQKSSGVKLLNHEIVELTRSFGEANAITVIDRAMTLGLRGDFLSVSHWILATYVFQKLPRGNEFLETLADGVAGKDGDPIEAYISKLIDYQKIGGDGRAVVKGKWLGMFKAYKGMMENAVIKNMRLPVKLPLDYPTAYPDYQD